MTSQSISFDQLIALCRDPNRKERLKSFSKETIADILANGAPNDKHPTNIEQLMKDMAEEIRRLRKSNEQMIEMMGKLKGIENELKRVNDQHGEMEEQLTQQTETIKRQQASIEKLASAPPTNPNSIAAALVDAADENPRTSASSRPTFVDVVKKSVQTALQEEKSKCDVIISKVEEKGQDERFVANLCTKMNHDTKPTSVIRLGRKSETTNYHRLLKLTFSTNFEARTFRSRFDEMKKSKSNKEFSGYRIRPGRSQEEQAVFRESSAVANRLNKQAKEAGDMCSYSVRDNGSIWKFEKRSDGKWVHISDWQLQGSGNDAGSSKPLP